MAITDKHIAVLKHKDTIVIIPTDGDAQKYARMFLEANAPSVIDEMRMFDELHLLSLQQNVNIVCVFRSTKKPAMEYKRVDGDITRTPRPDKELMDEIIVTAPVSPTFVREHPMRPAILDKPAFFEAMAKQTMPHCRFDYTDKGAEVPQVLRLVWV